MQKPVNNNLFDLIITKKDNKILVSGSIKNPSLYQSMLIISPNPADRRTSYSGTALPFPSEEIAFENTKNFLEIKKDGKINVEFLFPNSYYTPDGYTKIISPVIVYLDDKKTIVELDDLCPLKTLRDRVRGNPSFYGTREFLLPVANAEDVMINYANAKVIHNIA